MIGFFFVLFLGLELKHCVADYFLQPQWILSGKGNWRAPGGYAHAAVHAGLSGVVLLVAGTPLAATGAIILGEFVIHYALDYSKIRYSAGVKMHTLPARYWSLHGIDQLAHQLTYGAMIYAALLASGYA